MTDPLSVLNAEDPPVQPNPEFAARLRQRLESALSLPRNTRSRYERNHDRTGGAGR